MSEGYLFSGQPTDDGVPIVGWTDLGTADPPCTLDVQMAHQHELTFHFDAEGHVSKIDCSCGRAGTVEML